MIAPRVSTAALVVLSILLAGCAAPDQSAEPKTAAPAVGDETVLALPTPETGVQAGGGATAPDTQLGLDEQEQQIALAADRAPHIYMVLQQDGSRPVSVIFAIDESRDGTPEDDAAIRLTPEDGDCNAQGLRRYNFPEDVRGSPIFSGDELLRGVDPEQLPAFLAISVTDEMLRQNLVTDREKTRAHNICTRKMWEAQLANPATQG
ncbi:MAG: hypothetical protein AAF415_04725 [Pseudomonadota bacterium]